MNYWIEVTSGLRWSRMLKKGVVLKAPNETRYKNLFKDVRAGDRTLHYLTASLTSDKRYKSTIVASSRIISDPIMTTMSISAMCNNVNIFPKQIHVKKIKELNINSDGLKSLLNINMQRYLTKMNESDYKSIIHIYPDNARTIKR